MLIKSRFFRVHLYSTTPILSTYIHQQIFSSRTSWFSGKDYYPQGYSQSQPPFHPYCCSLCFQTSQPNCLAPFLLQTFQQNKPDWQRVIAETVKLKWTTLDWRRLRSDQTILAGMSMVEISLQQGGEASSCGMQGTATSSAGTAGARREHSSMAWVSRWISKRALLSL